MVNAIVLKTMDASASSGFDSQLSRPTRQELHSSHMTRAAPLGLKPIHVSKAMGRERRDAGRESISLPSYSK